jgi:hypothetical protein
MATMQQSRRTTDELAELVYRCISPDSNHDHDAHRAFDDALPDGQRGMRTSHELDYADFSLAAGVAYGIARGEDPYELSDSVAARAGEAATTAFERWGSWEVSYEQDRAARPVPDFYPEAGA